MSTIEILCIALLTFSAFCALVQAAKEVLLAKAQPPACPCRDLHSLTLTAGATFELPPGMKVSAATVADPRIVGIHERDIRTTFSTDGVEAVSASLRDLVLVDVDDDGSKENGLGLDCSLIGQPTTLGWLIDDHSQCRTKLSELMGYVTGGVLSKPGNSIEDVIGFARTAELTRLVEDHPHLVNSKSFVGMLKKELGDADASSLIGHADMLLTRAVGEVH